MATDRRSLLRAGLLVTALGATGGLSGCSRPPRLINDAEARASVSTLPHLDGTISTDAASLAAAADDFGHIVHHTPSAVVTPGSTDDVGKVIHWAGANQTKVAARGAGHSDWGRSEVSSGVAIEMTAANKVHAILPDRAVVDAGIKWSQLLAATLPHGLTPPVLTDYLELTVGGTIAVGGVGGTTYQFGVQSDNVLALDVVTGRGELVTCSPTCNADLFNAMRAGLGQVGVIATATVKLVPAHQSARAYTLAYADLHTLLADQRTLLADKRFDYLQGAVIPNPAGGWTYNLDGAILFDGTPPDDAAALHGLSDIRSSASLSTMSYSAWTQRLAPLEAHLRATGEWFNPHPWLTTYVGDSAIESVAGTVIGTLTPADLGTYGRVSIAPVLTSAITSPLYRLPAEPISFVFNVLRFPPNDQTVVNNMVTQNRAIYDRVLAAGGTLYPVSAFPMSADDWRTHFGPVYPLLAAAKNAYDPNHTLTPGYEIF